MSGRFAITGASGFIGSHLVRELLLRGNYVCAFSRRQGMLHDKQESRLIRIDAGDIENIVDWRRFFDSCFGFDLANSGLDCVIHCAARAHLVERKGIDELEVYRAVNVEGTRKLAEAAAKLGVKRFVYLSSIGVLGADTNDRGPFSDRDVPNAGSAYAISKLEGEEVLREIASRTGMEIVILRPPLVYGLDARGTMARLLWLARSGLPLPLGLIQGSRSLISLDNLVDVLILCAEHDRAPGHAFVVSDGEDLSVPELLRRMAATMGRPLRSFPVPTFLLRLIGRVFGRNDDIERLTGSLLIDSAGIREELGWVPPVSVDEGIRRMVKGA